MRTPAIRWTLIAFGALAALLIVCGILLRLLFDPDDYRTRIELAFKERTGRVLTLEGKLGLRLLPRLSVSTGPFAISDRPGASEGNFLTARDARVGLAVWPLLQRRVELGRLVLIAPALTLRIDKDGRDNWSDLFDRPDTSEFPDQPDAGRDEPATEGPELTVAGIVIEGGRLSFDDALRSRHLEFSDLEVETGALGQDASTSIRAGFLLERPDAAPLRSLVTGRVSRVRPRVWAAENLVVEVEHPANSGSGSDPLEGRIEAARLTADLDARHYSAPELKFRLGKAQGEASLEARQGESGLTVEGPVTIERTDLRALLKSLGVTLPQFRSAKAPGEVALKAALRYGSGLALRDLVAVVGGTRVTGNVELGRAPWAPAQFDLRGDRIMLDDYLPQSTDRTEATRPAGKATADYERLRKLAVRGRFAFGRVSFGKVDMSNVDGGLGLQDGVLELDPLRASVFGGSSQTRLRYELATDTPQLTLEQRLTSVDTAAMLGQLLNQKRMSGRGALTAQLSGAGGDRQALLANLSGPFEVRVTDGRFFGVDLWAEIERAVATAQGASPARSTGSGYTPFDRLEAQGRLDGKVIRNDQFDLMNPSMRARGAGTVNYGTGELDLSLTARLLEAPEGEVAGISLDRIVGVDVPLTVQGSLAAPKVRPDVKRLIEAAARHQLQQEGEDLEKKLREKLEDKLKDLLGQ
jgi:AsmA protein